MPKLNKDKLNSYIAIWHAGLKRYDPKFFAKGPSRNIDPRAVRHCVSCVFEDGVRTFAFKTRMGMDEFLKRYADARQCDNPYPITETEG